MNKELIIVNENYLLCNVGYQYYVCNHDIIVIRRKEKNLFI